MNISFDDAKRIVSERLKQISNKIGLDVILIENKTIEKDYYWVFFYNSKRYIETGNMSYTLAGNGPIIIDKIYGGIYKTGTAHLVDYYLKEFEERYLPVIIKR